MDDSVICIQRAYFLTDFDVIIKTIWVLYFKKESKRTKIRNFTYLESIYIIFDGVFYFEFIEMRASSSMSTDFLYHLWFLK
jgi:hypothetical protein